MTTSKVLGYVAFSVMLLFGALGGLFAAGYAFEDPGGWAAVGIVALYAVPAIALSGYAALRPAPAGRVLAVVTVVVALLVLLNAVVGLWDRDEIGPVDSIAVLGLGVALGFLGLHRPRLAGRLILAVALAQLLSLFARAAVHGAGDGPPLGAALGGSSGVVVVPMLLIGGLFVLAGSLEEPTQPGPRAPGPREPAAGRPGR